MANVQIVKVNAETTGYGDMKAVAKALEINPFGKSKIDLAAEINAKIDELGEEFVNEYNATLGGEVPAAPVSQTSTEGGEQEVTIPQVNESPESNNGVPVVGGEQQAPETPAAAATEKPKKWYEDGYGNQPGDLVKIFGKKIHEGTKTILVGRTAKVVGPSKTKKDTIQAILIDEKTGKEQGCIITLAFGEYDPNNEADVTIPARKTRKKAETAQAVEATPASEVTQTSETTEGQTVEVTNQSEGSGEQEEAQDPAAVVENQGQDQDEQQAS